MREIQLRDAKATLSKVLDEVAQGRAAIITRHGRKEAVILSFAEWERLSRVPSLGWLLTNAPAIPDDLLSRNPKSSRIAEL